LQKSLVYHALTSGTEVDKLNFLKTHELEGSMSRWGSCHGNAVAASFPNY